MAYAPAGWREAEADRVTRLTGWSTDRTTCRHSKRAAPAPIAWAGAASRQRKVRAASDAAATTRRFTWNRGRQRCGPQAGCVWLTD
ncbi:hypothetical protein GCM10023205_09090 [Yinghuangia aomiensis]|uniref:Uncharacterized protein n=1 Tax=Yinghuangia aomiensis TaxID=676205 RepID=A0ABP9GUI6_9ACTN